MILSNDSSAVESPKLSPTILTVAPNGARKTKADHPTLPLSPLELAECAASCLDAGASMLHLHVRDEQNHHSLAPEHYRPAIEAIKDRIGDQLILQTTTEAVGRYSPSAQIAAMQMLKPEALSLGLREYVPDPRDRQAETRFLDFLEECASWGSFIQFILYSTGDLNHFLDLWECGEIPIAKPSLLFVLGRYSLGQYSHPCELIPFLATLEQRQGSSAVETWPWSVCAFGPLEAACAATAIGLGGNARLGFENNLHLPNGQVAPDNAALIALAAQIAQSQSRQVATAETARQLMAIH